MNIRENEQQSKPHHADKRPKRRIFSRDKKLAILDEIDKKPDELGLILRREGLYSSQLYQWRLWRKSVGNTKPEKETMKDEMARIKRENSRLTAKLERAERIIEIQKKTSEFLNLPPISEFEMN